jgi:GTP cyclohydrolase II
LVIAPKFLVNECGRTHFSVFQWNFRDNSRARGSSTLIRTRMQQTNPVFLIRNHCNNNELINTSQKDDLYFDDPILNLASRGAGRLSPSFLRTATGKGMDIRASGFNGEPGYLRCERGLGDFRRGRWVLFTARGTGDSVLVTAVDSASPPNFAALGGLELSAPWITVSPERASALGFGTPNSGLALSPQAKVSPSPSFDSLLSVLREPHLDAARPSGIVARPAHPSAEAALSLLRLERIQPALVGFDLPKSAQSQIDTACAEGSLVRVFDSDVAAYPQTQALGLRRVSEAKVPLSDSLDSSFIVFREPGGREHVAIEVGSPNRKEPVLLRLHSACLTGDLFGSLRCDCGEQLRGAIGLMQDAGGGVLLYLAQEGRGIGLGNKIRAYAIQDQGLDTLDADRVLGFGEDERRWETAAAILRDLGIRRVELMTNNPEKIAALRNEGVLVEDRRALQAPIHRYNARYMTAKAERAGHLLDDAE